MATTEAAIIRHADGIYEHGGLLWRPKPAATSTFEEREWAGAFYIELHRDAHWNPWRKGEEAAELKRAHAVMDEWGRAEPDFKLMTDEELKAKFARQDRAWDAEVTPRPGEPLGVVAEGGPEQASQETGPVRAAAT